MKNRILLVILAVIIVFFILYITKDVKVSVPANRYLIDPQNKCIQEGGKYIPEVVGDLNTEYHCVKP